MPRGEFLLDSQMLFLVDYFERLIDHFFYTLHQNGRIGA